MAGESLICPHCHSLHGEGAVCCERCGEVLAALPLDGPGFAHGTMVAGQFRIDCEIGRGAMGIVYRGTDVLVGQRVALKVIRPELAANERFRKRLLNEVRTARTINHANVVRVHGLQFWQGLLFMSMEYLEGEDLHRRLLRCGPLAEADARQVLRGACAGLKVAHERQIIHRDINAKNLFLTATGVKILDFGVARDLDLTEFTGSRIFGTPAYMAPELLKPEGERQEEADCQTDIWSLGVTAYQMLTGQLPYQADDLARFVALLLTRDPRPLKEVKPEVSDDMAAIVHRMLARDREVRYQNVGGILGDLEGSPRQSRLKGGLRKWKSANVTRYLKAGIAVGAMLLLFLGGVHEYRHWSVPQVNPEIALAEAEAYMKLGLFAPPSAKNALSSIRSVLQADPNDKGALALLQQLKVEVAKRCRLAVRARQTEAAIDYYRQLKLIAPQQPELVRAAAEITRLQRKQRERQYARQLARELADQGDALLASGAVVRPPGGNAIERYQQALRLDPANLYVRNQLKAIRAKLVGEATVAINAGNPYRAREVLVAAGQVAEGPDVKALLAKVEGMIAKRRRKLALAPTVESAIKEGRRHLAARRYVLPPGANAYESLAQAIALDPESAEARSLMAQVRGALMSAGERALREGKLQEARFQFQNALTVEKMLPGTTTTGEPAEPKLAAVIALIQAREAERLKQREVGKLLAQARDYERLGELVTPDDGGAVALLKRALQLDPDNPEVKQRLLAMSKLLVTKAEGAVARQQYEEAHDLYSLVLEVDPGNRVAMERRSEVKELASASREKLRREKNLRHLVALADKAFSRGSYWSGRGGGALALYRKVLELEPNDARARERLKLIKANYLKLADREAAQGDLKSALISLEVAGRADPGDETIVAKIERLRDKLAAAENLEREIEVKLIGLKKAENRGDLAQALAGYLEIIDEDPRNQAARAALARVKLAYVMQADRAAAEGDYDASLKLIRQAQRADPADSNLKRKEARITELKDETVKSAGAVVFRPLTSF